MQTRTVRRALHALTGSILSASLLIITPAASAQCPFGWASGFGASGHGADDGPMAWAVFDDDGPGPHPPALYVGGWFNTAGGVTVNKIARWTGSGWAPLGTGINGANVVALAVYDEDGPGPRVAGLYAAGDFFFAGGVSATHIAKWDGFTWSPVGPGLSGGRVYTLLVYDDGTGEKLFAGGDFAFAGGTPVPKVARWNGSAWSSVPNNFNSEVDILYAYNGELYAGGMFSSPGNNMARWTGASWAPMGIGMDGHVVSMASFGGQLYVAGFFRHAGGVEANYIARWDGVAWSAVNGGVGGTTPPEAPFVRALQVFDDGTGPALYLAGEFHTAGGVAANSIARWDGTNYSALGQGISGTLPWVFSLAVFDEGAGPALWAGGVFDNAGPHASRCVARWGCAPCYPDCDASGTLNVNDFVCFQSRFAANDPYANCDGSTSLPVLNVNDFVCFGQRFAGGCR